MADAFALAIFSGKIVFMREQIRQTAVCRICIFHEWGPNRKMQQDKFL